MLETRKISLHLFLLLHCPADKGGGWVWVGFLSGISWIWTECNNIANDATVIVIVMMMLLLMLTLMLMLAGGIHHLPQLKVHISSQHHMIS